MIIFLTQAGLEPRFAAQVCKDDRLFAEKHLPRSILARNIRRATFHDKHFARRQEAFARSILYEVFCENQKQIFRVDFGNRALEKVDKEQLNRKPFEIYQTISCFGAFLLTLSFNNITKLASKSRELSTLFQIIIESMCIMFLFTLLKNIHTSFSRPSLTYL